MKDRGTTLLHSSKKETPHSILFMEIVVNGNHPAQRLLQAHFHQTRRIGSQRTPISLAAGEADYSTLHRNNMLKMYII